MLAAGLGHSTEARVVAEEKVAGVERFGFEGGAVGGDKEPMVDLVAQQLNAAKGRKVAPEGGIRGVRGLGEDEPDAVVSG